MKSFKQLQEEIKKSDGIVFSFGRFSPPTNGHELVMNKVLSLAKKNKYDNIIYASQSFDKKKNPLKWSDKIKVMAKMFSKVNISRDKTIKTPFQVLPKLADAGYKHVIFIVGSDRVNDFAKNMEPYTSDFDTFKVVSAGQRDPDAEGTKGMSGSKMRQFAKDNDFIRFNVGLPKSYKDGKKLFELVKKGMK